MFVRDGKRFLPTSGYNEDRLEEVLLQEEELFHGFLLVDRKLAAKPKESKKGTLNDLVLVSNDCEQWFIIEVEVKNDDYYAKNHINDQLAAQTQANWRDRIIPKLGKQLVEEHDFPAETVMRLEENDPGFILIIPKTTEIISGICRKFGVQIIEAEIWEFEDEEAIFVSSPETIPQRWNKERFQAEWERVFTDIHFYFNAAMTDMIEKAENCFFYIDEKQFSVDLGLKKEIAIPLSDNPGDHTHDLVFRKKLKALFSSDMAEGNLYIHFEREDIWTS